MKSDSRLDAAVFQLTPTRTRCDLVIKANGSMEKIASGLLNPFLAHLKTARDQIAKGGYSITLKPHPGADAAWFTKGTLERFVRFVSTPEILERVDTIESEILQIDEAINIQGNENLYLNPIEEDQTGSMDQAGGRRKSLSSDAASAIVLYQPGPHPESRGLSVREEDSKVHFLRVLETRRMVLRNEQGMAFARAAAAGFTAENMADLISFAECFGAKRMLKASHKFTELWKRKHETDQWPDIQASEAMSMRSEFPSMSSIDANLSPDTKKHKDFTEQWAACNHGRSKESNDNFTGQRAPGNSQAPPYPPMYFLGQFPHPVFPHCPIHSPPGAPAFQPYPMPGMPCYQSHFPPAYAPSGGFDPRLNPRQGMESDAATTTSEEDRRSSCGSGKARGGRAPQRRGQSAGRKLGGNDSRKADGNNPEKHRNASDTESCSASGNESEDLPSCRNERNERDERNEGTWVRSSDGRNPPDEAMNPEQEADSGNWQAFQSFLLRNDEERASGADTGLLSGEKQGLQRRRRSKQELDSSLRPERRSAEAPGRRRMVGSNSGDGEASGRFRYEAPSDDKNDLNGDSRDQRPDVLLGEIQGERGAYKKRGSNDEFAVYEQDELLSNGRRSSNLLASGEYRAGCRGRRKSSSCSAPDESFVVPLRPDSPEQHRRDNSGCGIAADVFASGCSPAARELPPDGVKNQPGCHPDDLSLMPARGMEGEPLGYDPAQDYNKELVMRTFAAAEKGAQAREGPNKGGDKGKKRSMTGLEKQRVGSMLRKKGNPSKLSPLAEAQARANKLRAFKADLQRAKKEKEEDDLRRLEALKKERQQRIAARSSIAARSPVTPDQKLIRLPAKASAESCRISSSSGASGPLKAGSAGATSSQGMAGGVDQRRRAAAGSRLTRSLSSLPDMRRGEARGAAAQPKRTSLSKRRLPEPNGAGVHRSSTLRSAGSGKTPPQSSSGSKEGGGGLHGSSSRSAGGVQVVRRPHLSDGPKIKTTSATAAVGRLRSAVLPADHRARPPRGPSETTGKGPGKDGSGSKSENKERKISEGKTLHQKKRDDEGAVEKIFVLPERGDAGPLPVLAEEGERLSEMGNRFPQVDATPAFNGGQASSSSSAIHEVGNRFSKVKIGPAKENPKSVRFSLSDEPYQPQHRRAASMGEPCARDVSYEASGTVGSSTGKLDLWRSAESRLQEAHKNEGRPRGKEPLKGLRKLFRFGRKSTGTSLGDSGLETCSLHEYDQMGAVAASPSFSTEVAAALKNSVAMEEGHAEGTPPPKAFRRFSILSPFRSKSGGSKKFSAP